MPNYFYVKSGGTRGTSDTPYTSQQTGSFPASTNCYDNVGEVASVVTTPPTHGDFILVSDAHSHTYSANASYVGPQSNGVGLTVMSVSDTSCNTYSRGATESGGTSNKIYVLGVISVLGIDFLPGDNLEMSNDGSIVLLYDCLSKVSGISDRPLSATADTYLTAINCTFEWNYSGVGGPVAVLLSALWEFIDCTFTGSGMTAVPILSTSTSQNRATFTGCDFSGLTGISYLLDDQGSNVYEDEHEEFIFKNCKFPALTDYRNGPPASKGHVLKIVNSADTSAAAEYQFHYENGAGVVDDETGKYRDNSTAYPSGQKVSLRVVSDTNVSTAYPFVFDFPTRYAELSNTASDTARIYLTCASTLNNDDVYVEVIYPDGTNKHTPNKVESIGEHLVPGDFRNTAPVALTTNTEAWTGGLTYKYHIDIDTSTDAGADCYPIIRAYVAKASTTIYFDSEVVIA